MIAASGATVVALVVSGLALAWNIVSWGLGQRRKNRPDVLATLVANGVARITFVNAGEGVARYLLFVTATRDQLFQGGVKDGFLFPHQDGTVELGDFNVTSLGPPVPVAWAYLDANGNLYVRSVDRPKAKRYRKKDAKREIGSLFREMYPDAQVPDAFDHERPKRWIGD